MATVVEPKKITRPQIHQTQCFIDGQWLPAASGKTFDTIDPATEETIASVAEGDAEDVDAAVKAARHALEHGPWATMDARERGRLMYKLADLIEDELDELAALESLDNGKPIKDAKAADLPLVIDCLRYYAGYADKIHGQTIPIRGNYFCYTRKEPVGVVGQIIPWNFPMLMTAWKWGPALAAGCTIVMKPAEQTPLTCLRMARLAQKAGFPDGVINVVPGYGPTAGAAIVKHRGIDKVAFTGEHLTAQTIMREAAESLKRLTFELGGKSPNVVFADADLDAAIDGAHFGLYFNQGQCCCAGSRVFVQESIHDEFVERITEINTRRRVGPGLDPETEQGPQVDKAQFDKIMGFIEKGEQGGARRVSGGERVGDRGYFIEPTLFDGVTDDMDIATARNLRPGDERPQVQGRGGDYRASEQHLLRPGRRRLDPRRAKAHHYAAKVKAGTVWVNCYDVFDAAAPFGGYKMSGMGRELGEEGLKPYLETKTVTVAMNS